MFTKPPHGRHVKDMLKPLRAILVWETPTAYLKTGVDSDFLA